MPQYRQCIGPDGNINPDQIYEIESLSYIPRGSSAWDVYEQWVVDGGVTLPPENTSPPSDVLAIAARQIRDGLLRNICDAGVLMIQRELRLTSDPARITYLNAKLQEVDEYAVLLLGVPEQPSFPQTITWPVAPTP